MSTATPSGAEPLARVLGTAVALALASAVALGLARFSYALLLPPMRADLGWSYFTAGAMNTANAAGYLVGALLAPALLRRLDARLFMLAGGLGTALLLALHGAVRGDTALYTVRTLAGVCSAASFIGGGLMSARLAGAAGARAGLVLGIYYGGVGLGILASALVVPPLVARAADGWSLAWVALGAAALAATAVTAHRTRAIVAPPLAQAQRVPLAWRSLGWGLAGYLMFGLGYIGYMTFVVTLLRERGMGGDAITAFYALMGLGVMASSWLWAGLLQRYRGGGPMALLNALLALATALPVLSAQPLAVFGSGVLFGCVFLSVVASTTALVRHNAEPAAWPAGIAAFTIVFAAGQIVGPIAVGLIADSTGGLTRGLGLSAVALLLGAALAARQRPVR
jgi:predicted MFS family arabinose efflux permease